MIFKKRKYFFVDDDEIQNFLVEQMLEINRVEHKAVFFTAPDKALQSLFNHDAEGYPDMIFLDIQMPGLNGFQFLQEYRRLARKHNKKPVPVAMLTSSVDVEDRRQAAENKEIIAYINKPLNYHDFKRVEQMAFEDKNK